MQYGEQLQASCELRFLKWFKRILTLFKAVWPLKGHSEMLLWNGLRFGRVEFLCGLQEMVRACCLVALRFVLWLRIFLSSCCCLIIILQVSGEEGVNIVFWFILWSRSKWTLKSLEKTVCMLLFKEIRFYCLHLALLNRVTSRKFTIFLFALIATTSLTSCFFFSMRLEVAFFLCALESLCTQKCDTVIVVQPHFILIFEFGCYQWQHV